MTALFLSAASCLWAQQAPAHEAVLELKVAASDVVVRGTVLSVQRHDNGEFHEVRITVKVLETIKGENRGTIEFSESEISTSNSYTVFKERYFNLWRAGAYEFLWFFAKPDTAQTGLLPVGHGGRAEIPLVLDLRPLTPAGFSAIFPDGYVTTDLKVLTRPDDILAAVRDAASYQPPRKGDCDVSDTSPTIPGCAVGVPYRMLVRPGDGYVQYLHMPVDERMETLCRRMIQQSEDLWTIPPANPSTFYNVPDLEKTALVREQVVQCLRAFRSPANIELLKSIVTLGGRSSGQTGPRPRFDEVRAAAEILTSWRILQ